MTAAWWETWGDREPGAASFWVASHAWRILARRFGVFDNARDIMRASMAGDHATAERLAADGEVSRIKVDAALQSIGWTSDDLMRQAGLLTRKLGVYDSHADAPAARAWVVAHHEEHVAAGQAIADAWEARTA